MHDHNHALAALRYLVSRLTPVTGTGPGCAPLVRVRPVLARGQFDYRRKVASRAHPPQLVRRTVNVPFALPAEDDRMAGPDDNDEIPY